MHAFFQRASALSPAQRAAIGLFLTDKQPFVLYFDSAIRDLARGIDNRWLCHQDGAGLAMGIEFDGLAVFTTVGTVSPEVLGSIAAYPGSLEMHLPEEQAQRVRPLAGARLVRDHNLLYFGLERNSPFGEDRLSLRRLGPADLELVNAFYATHYDGTIFSSWMLSQPFVGLFEKGELVSAGGTVVLSHAQGAANLGNFLTACGQRGKGHARRVARRLVDELLKEGITHFTLGTTAENKPACRVYESIGFRVLESRRELELAPAQ